jgi:mannosidase alpha-like ER degradation enhancer 2
MMKTRIIGIALLIVAGCYSKDMKAQKMTIEQKSDQCEKIKAACRHAWVGYKQYAWKDDALKPISRKGHNWYKTSLLMTPVDAFDTFILMGLDKEASEAKELILSRLKFNLDMEVQVFEVNIRLLGGLLSAYELSGEPRFLTLAEDLGRRLLPAFKSATGMPFRYVNLKTGRTRDPLNNPAEIGTSLLEFGKLTQLTGDSLFYRTSRNAVFEVYNRRSAIDLVGTVIDVTTGEWKNTECQIGARVDSYYEYLFKAWLLFGDEGCRAAWETMNRGLEKYLLTTTPKGWFYTRVDMNTGKETNSLYGALDAFYAGVLTLAGELNTAKNIQMGNYYMWTHFGIEPEEFNFRNDSITSPGYPLRPENIECCFYLYRKTKSDIYLHMGARMIGDVLEKCKTEAGFASVKDVRTKELEDSMESFFFAETLKYSYLLFAPESLVDIDKVVFTTEAHPFKMTSYE